MILNKNTTAPEFELYATPDQKLKRSDFLGKNLIIAFYPADFSPVCSDQMSLYNEMLKVFRNYNAELLGISTDGKWCHSKFSKERNIHFPLLADFYPQGKVSKLFGVYNEQEGIAHRALFVIDVQGTIQWSYLSPDGINPGADGIINALDEVNSTKK